MDLELEKKLCKEKNISFSEYETFFQEKFPDFNTDKEVHKKYPRDNELIIYKIQLFKYAQGVAMLAENNSALEFNNPDKYHLRIFLNILLQSANKFIVIGTVMGRPFIMNDIGLVRISLGECRGKIFRV